MTALQGRWALVTGASRGIGRAAAAALGREGARVVLVARDAEALAAAADEVRRGSGAQVETATADVGDREAVAALLAALCARHGGAPDVVVNSAGRFGLAPLHATSVDEFAATVETNLVGPFVVLRAVVPAMRARGSGHLVTVGSIADRHAYPENAAYAASKYGLRGLHEVLRAELRDTGVRATLVSPGPVDTALWDEIDPDTRPGFTPRAAMLRAEAVAEAIRWVVTLPPEVNVDELRLSRS